MSSPIVFLRIAQLTFWAALIFTFVCAVMPARRAVSLVPWDKAGHFLAFYVLALLAAAAFPRLHVIWIAIVLFAFGAAIEIIQGFELVSRDRDVWDWVANTLAITAALAPMFEDTAALAGQTGPPCRPGRIARLAHRVRW